MATKTYPFRFSENLVRRLDQLVDWYKTRGPYQYGVSVPNRSAVLRALVEAEYTRLHDEEARVQEALEKANDIQPSTPRKPRKADRKAPAGKARAVQPKQKIGSKR